MNATVTWKAINPRSHAIRNNIASARNMYKPFFPERFQAGPVQMDVKVT